MVNSFQPDVSKLKNNTVLCTKSLDIVFSSLPNTIP